MEVEIVVQLARARVREKRDRGTEFDHLLALPVTKSVCIDDVAGAGNLGFDEIPGYRLVEKTNRAASRRLANQAGCSMTRNKLARSSSAAQERVLQVLPLLPRTVLMPT